MSIIKRRKKKSMKFLQNSAGLEMRRIKVYFGSDYARYHENMWFFSQNELWFPSNCYVKIKFSANISKLLDCYPIKKIITNGRNEYESLVTDYKWDLEDRGMFENCTFLPSTTPANRLDKNIWIDALRNPLHHPQKPPYMVVF